MAAPDIDPARVAALLRQVGQEVIVPRFEDLREGDISEKKNGELVTVVDLASEAWLTERLLDLLPGSTVVGEEAVFVDPDVLTRLTGPAPAWIVDPIDGTWNFAHGRPTFAVIVGLAVAGEVVGGWIHEPVAGTLAQGMKGQGVTFDGAPVRLPAPEGGFGGGRVAGTAARHLFERAEGDDTLVGEVHRTNCAGHEYMLILSGVRQFSAYTKLMPWDHAAGSFLVREAGGHSALLDAAAYDIARPAGELLSATSEALWERLRAVLTEAPERTRTQDTQGDRK